MREASTITRTRTVALLGAALWLGSAGLALAVPPPPEDAAAVSVTSGEAEWTADEKLSRKAQKRDRKRYRNKKDVSLSVSIDGGRGSVFVDGEWAGEAPVSGFEVKPGRHDVEVRDGETVLGAGILKIQRGSDAVTLSVAHPDDA